MNTRKLPNMPLILIKKLELERCSEEEYNKPITITPKEAYRIFAKHWKEFKVATWDKDQYLYHLTSNVSDKTINYDLGCISLNYYPNTNTLEVFEERGAGV